MADQSIQNTKDFPAAGAKSPSNDKNFSWVFGILPALVTFLVFLPVLKNDFVNWDDRPNILNNPHICSLNFDSLKWMLTAYYNGFWSPLTWFSYALDYKLGGLNPKIFHFHNLLLHVLNTAIVYYLSRKILNLVRGNANSGQEGQNQWPQTAAFITALFFGIHPIHVENVALASDRKDLLCGLFFLLSLWVYLHGVFSNHLKTWKIPACLGLFILALTAKPMAVSLPVVLLLFDYWPLKRFASDLRKALLEKIPFFILAILAGWVTTVAEVREGALQTLQTLPIDLRLLNASRSVLFYLWKMAVPTDLSGFYPLMLFGEKFFTESMGSFFLILLVTAACFILRGKRPYLSASWLYYLATLAPVLGLVQVGSHAAADRYTYIPSLAPFLLLSAALAVPLHKRRMAFFLGMGALAVVLGIMTARQIETWKDAVSLWENAAKVAPGNSFISHHAFNPFTIRALAP